MKLAAGIAFCILILVTPNFGFGAAHESEQNFSFGGSSFPGINEQEQCNTLSIFLLNHLAHARYDELTGNVTFPKIIYEIPSVYIRLHTLIIDGDVALVGWSAGYVGGRILLRKNMGYWTTSQCSGGELYGEQNLVSSGLSDELAGRLGARQFVSESMLPTETIERMDSFEGTVFQSTQGLYD